MSKLFDKILVNRIGEVFSNHEETYNPADWKKLQSKMNRPRKGMVIIWPHIAKAASVILFLGVAVFTANKYEDNKTTRSYQEKVILEQFNEEPTNTSISKTDSIENDEFESRYVKNAYEKNDNNVSEKKLNKNVTILNENNDILIVENDSCFEGLGNQRFGDVRKVLVEHHNEIKRMDSVRYDSDKPVLREYDEFIIADNAGGKDKRFGFGVELASVSNYSTSGTSDGVNLGGGMSASYRITDRISFATGAIIAKQSVNYVGERQNERAYSDLNLAFADNSLSKVENMTSSDSEVSFVAIDIPLNVRYKHKRISFTTGFSSLVYLQEKYSYSYNAVVSNSVYNHEIAEYETITSNTTLSNEETKSFNHIDFAHLLNLSIGYDIPLAKGNLVVEPYLKYPLGNISSKEIFMGSGGFALRYDF